MKIVCRRFQELTLRQLYDILALRVNVFVVEQNCPYEELDYRDQEAVHVWLEDEEGVQAYLRVMDRGVESEYVSIGRVIARKRRGGLGTSVLQAGIKAAEEMFHADQIYLEAQTYAIPFYERSGFQVVSDVFDIDGIPHVKMLKG